MKSDDLLKNIKKLIEPLQEKFHALIPDMEQEVNYIIRNKIRDIDRIEKLADALTNAHNMVDVKYLFDKLMNYYSTFEKSNAQEQKRFFKDMFDNEDQVLLQDTKNEINDEIPLYKTALEIIKNGKNRLELEISMRVNKTFWELGKLLNTQLNGKKSNSKEFKKIISEMSCEIRKKEKSDLLFTEEHLKETHYFYKLFPDFSKSPRLLSWSYYHLIFSKVNKKDWLKYISYSESKRLSYENLKQIIEEGMKITNLIKNKSENEGFIIELPFKN